MEIKLDKPINAHLIRNVRDKIHKFDPFRYYILSCISIQDKEKSNILEVVELVKNEHGCQIITNGVIDTIKYYLRLVNCSHNFLNNYLRNIEIDTELKKEHKDITNLLIEKHFIKINN